VVRHVGYDFGAYRDLLQFAKENGIDVVALNRRRSSSSSQPLGLDNVPRESAGSFRDRRAGPWQREVLRGVFGGHAGHGGGDNAFESFLRFSCSGRRRWRSA